MTRDRLPVDANVGEIALVDALGIDATRARDVLQNALDLFPNPLDDRQIGSEDLDADWCLRMVPSGSGSQA